MNFTYKIENYYPYESRLFIIYTPIDNTFEPMGGWVSISAEMSEVEITSAIIQQAPYYRWEQPKSEIAQALVGSIGSGEKTSAPVETATQIIAKYTYWIQERLDNFARTRNYDSILSACSYVTSTVPQFVLEAQYCVEIRDATWAKCYEILNSVNTGVRPMPTLLEIEAELPVLTWPVL